MSKKTAVNFLGGSCKAGTLSQAKKDAKTSMPRKGHPDNSTPAFIVKDLTKEEGDHVSSLSEHTRVLVISDLSQIHGIANPVRGYLLVEKVVISICRILNQNVVQALELPKWSKDAGKQGVPKLPQHSEKELVRKVCEPLMETMHKKSDTGRLLLRSISISFWHS